MIDLSMDGMERIDISDNGVVHHNNDIRHVNKGWGFENIFVNNPYYCGKILHFMPDKKSSMHYHARKYETFYVISGDFVITLINPSNASKIIYNLSMGQKLDIPRFCCHQIYSITEGEIIEVSTHDDPSDSYRVEPGASQQ